MARPEAVARRKNIYDLLVLGHATKEIANRLFLTDSGVRHHVTKIYFENNVTAHAELVAKHWVNKIRRDKTHA